MTNEDSLKPLAEQVLIGEIALQSRLAERAAGQLAAASGPLETWGAIQSLLVAAANVSKILWPAGKGHKARGEQLRDLLGVADRTLDPVRAFRNHFEHYDERIDQWFENDNSSVYMDLASGPRQTSAWGLPRMLHRGYDPSSQTLYFRDESIDLRTVVATLEEIREKCRPFALTDWD